MSLGIKYLLTFLTCLVATGGIMFFSYMVYVVMERAQVCLSLRRSRKNAITRNLSGRASHLHHGDADVHLLESQLMDKFPSWLQPGMEVYVQLKPNPERRPIGGPGWAEDLEPLLGTRFPAKVSVVYASRGTPNTASYYYPTVRLEVKGRTNNWQYCVTWIDSISY